ncbi:MAG: AbrB/MazE/SpoVT family DNA-binding domain-containing protein [Nitrososphaerales archaeon]
MVKLRLKVGEKGQILIPKVLREKYGVKEEGYVLIEPRDEGILLRGRPSPNEIFTILEQHVSKLRSSGVKGPRLGDLKSVYLEMEFQEKGV